MKLVFFSNESTGLTLTSKDFLFHTSVGIAALFCVPLSDFMSKNSQQKILIQKIQNADVSSNFSKRLKLVSVHAIRLSEDKHQLLKETR